jgi:transcriptional regulator with XRE-family HTH domain
MSGAETRRAGYRDPGGLATGNNRPSVERATRLGLYLRKLRQGYGYTLRKVEEQAVSMGEAIDNSQLSRFEKGKAVPSFDKLRALARVFNVPVQNFSDVLDLEEYQQLKPDSESFGELLKAGSSLMAKGETGRAFVTYERALEIAESLEDPAERGEMIAEARWRMACALKALGKLFMAEHELREILKGRERLSPKTRLRALLQIGYLYRELGDLYLASVLVRECLALAREQNDLSTRAGVLNSLGNILHDGGRPAEAVEHYREALAVLEELEGNLEMKTTVMTNLGGSLVATGQFDQGFATLRSARVKAQQNGFRRVAALAVTRMAEAWEQRGERARARELLSESDSLASRVEGSFHDILFLNAFHRWQMVREEKNSTGERIAFGRLRHLRSLLQRRFPEVDAFDRHVERIRR